MLWRSGISGCERQNNLQMMRKKRKSWWNDDILMWTMFIRKKFLLVVIILSVWCRLIWAMTWQNQQNGCASKEDLDQPGHPPSLIRVFTVRMKKPWVLSYPLSTQWRLLIRLGGCPGWSESSLGAHSFCWFVMRWLNWIFLTRVPQETRFNAPTHTTTISTMSTWLHVHSLVINDFPKMAYALIFSKLLSTFLDLMTLKQMMHLILCFLDFVVCLLWIKLW